MEAKNIANVAATLAACSFKTHSSKVAEKDRKINLQVFTFNGTSTSSSKASPIVSDPPHGFTLEQLKWMEEKLMAQEVDIINRINNIQHTTSFKKPVNTESIVSSCPLPAPSAPRTIDFPYGIMMNAPKGQVGSSAAVCWS